MGKQLNSSLSSLKLSKALGLDHFGREINIFRVSPISCLDGGGVSFSNSPFHGLCSVDSLIICPRGSCVAGASYLYSERPRLDFARALLYIDSCVGFSLDCSENKVSESAVISSSARIGKGVVIGDRTIIGHNVVIGDGVKIGVDCVVKSNTVIGEPGFGFERDDQGYPVRLLHLGSVEIGDRVELGSLNTVCAGTLLNTVVENDVKTDDHVHIAHNCRIKEGALIAACAEFSGGVCVGAFSWVGPNTSFIQKVRLGDWSLVGIGANVIKDVQSHVVVAGNPAKYVKDNV